MADYTGFILGTNNIVELQELSGSLSFTPPAPIAFGSIRINSFFPDPKAFSQPIYRGLVGGNYVYNLGNPPIGATDVVIVGYKEV